LASCVNRQNKFHVNFRGSQRNDLLFALMSKCNKMAQNKPCNCFGPANCNCCPTTQGRSLYFWEEKGSDRFKRSPNCCLCSRLACEVAHKLCPENGSRVNVNVTVNSYPYRSSCHGSCGLISALISWVFYCFDTTNGFGFQFTPPAIFASFWPAFCRFSISQSTNLAIRV